MPMRDLGSSENEEVVDVRYIRLKPGQGDQFLKDLRKAHDKMRQKEEQDKRDQRGQSRWKLW